MAEVFSPTRWAERPPLFTAAGCVAVLLSPDDAPALQSFLDANPGYSQIVAGRPWLPDEAASELAERPPTDWPQGATRHLALLDARDGGWRGLLFYTEDLLAPQVWHLALFLVASAWHGRGLAAALHQAWEDHAAAQGAHWLRLGVVIGNARAERFWERMGYQDVRLRRGLVFGQLTQDVRLMVRPLGEATLAEHLARVPRDRPDNSAA